MSYSWDSAIAAEDERRYECAGFGRTAGVGKCPAPLNIDGRYRTIGNDTNLLDDALDGYTTAYDEIGWHTIGRIGRPPKKQASAFFGSSPVSYLFDLRVDSIVVTGCLTSGADANNFNSLVRCEVVCDRVCALHQLIRSDVGQKSADVLSAKGSSGCSASCLIGTAEMFSHIWGLVTESENPPNDLRVASVGNEMDHRKGRCLGLGRVAWPSLQGPPHDFKNSIKRIQSVAIGPCDLVIDPRKSPQQSRDSRTKPDEVATCCCGTAETNDSRADKP